MSYEGTHITDELSESVQRAVGITPRWHETLGEAESAGCPPRAWTSSERKEER